jgi:hypothetical protein
MRIMLASSRPLSCHDYGQAAFADCFINLVQLISPKGLLKRAKWTELTGLKSAIH